MFGLGVALVVLGYGVSYWAILNFRNGGKGPGFAETLGLSQTLTVPTGDKGTPNLTGQPATSNNSPGEAQLI